MHDRFFRKDDTEIALSVIICLTILLVLLIGSIVYDNARNTTQYVNAYDYSIIIESEAE